MESHIWYYLLGFSAQALFSARMFIQWILSEKQKRIISPTIFWQLSLLASLLLSLYGWLRGDFAIILGQVFSYYIYIWNLNIKNDWKRMHFSFRLLILFIPFVAIVSVLLNGEKSFERLFKNIPLGLLIFGSMGQLIFTFRFVYQWLYSRKRKQSLLPLGFWLLSIVGALITIIYGVFRSDPVLIISQGIGFIVYARNVFLSRSKATE